tara:strand:+ start:2840 stop:3079 length:240 start_codon:yes stop_codon:yes gene_type:complete
MERAADTRHKIQLGGLVIKAGLDDLASNELLGALLEIRDIIDSPDADQNLRRFMRRGRSVFEEDEKRREPKQPVKGDFE